MKKYGILFLAIFLTIAVGLSCFPNVAGAALFNYVSGQVLIFF